MAARLSRTWRRLRSPAAADVGAQRWRRIFVSAGSSVGARGVAMACNLLTIPVALRYLGASQYGLWLTLTSSVNLLSCFDFGIGIGLQNRVSEMMGRDRLTEAGACIRSTMVVLGFIAVLLFAVLLTLVFGTDLPGRLFSSGQFKGAAMDEALAIVVGAFVVGLPLSLFSRVAMGLQQGWIASVAAAIGTFLTLVGVTIAARASLSFMPFVAIAVIPPLAAQIICFVLVARRLPDGLRLFGPISLADGVRTLRDGSPYVLPQIGGLVVSQTPLIVLGTMGSPVSAAIYGVFIRLNLPFQQLQQMFLDQVWPAITEALHRGDRAWLRQTLRWLVRLCVGYGVLTVAAMIAALVLVFPLLTRASGLHPSGLLIVLFSVNAALAAVTQAFAYLANGLKRVRRQSWIAVANIVVAFAVLPALTTRFDMAGMLVGLLLLNGVVAMPLLYWEYASYLARSARAGEGEATA